MVTHFTHFEKVAVFSGSVQPKVRTEENIETVQGRMEAEVVDIKFVLRKILTVQLKVKWNTYPNYLILSQQTELSVSTCQRMV
jgi:hypothetical protein